MDNFQQSYLDTLLIDKIKKYILKVTQNSTWEQYIHSLHFGFCDLTAFLAASVDPKHVQIIEVGQRYDEELAEGFNIEDHGNHFINKIGDKYYDFGKGTNTVEEQGEYGIYLIGTEQQMMNVQLDQDQLSHFYFIDEDPIPYKDWKSLARYKSFLKDPKKYI